MDNQKLQRIAEIGEVLTRLANRGEQLSLMIKSNIENIKSAKGRNDQGSVSFFLKEKVKLLDKKKHVEARIIKYACELNNELGIELNK